MEGINKDNSPGGAKATPTEQAEGGNKMVRKFKATINYTTDRDHPDTNKEERLNFSDIYYIDEDYFWGDGDIILYIKDDLRLVVGGGYDTKHIHNVKFDIKEIKNNEGD